MSSSSGAAELADMAEYSEHVMGDMLYQDTDINRNEADDKKAVKPHAQVHLLSATENCKVCVQLDFEYQVS